MLLWQSHQALHCAGRLDLHDTHWKFRKYDPWKAYGQSKICSVLFSRSLPGGKHARVVPRLAPFWFEKLHIADVTLSVQCCFATPNLVVHCVKVRNKCDH